MLSLKIVIIAGNAYNYFNHWFFSENGLTICIWMSNLDSDPGDKAYNAWNLILKNQTKESLSDVIYNNGISLCLN